MEVRSLVGEACAFGFDCFCRSLNTFQADWIETCMMSCHLIWLNDAEFWNDVDCRGVERV